MKRVFIFIISFLLSFSLFRACLDEDPLTFSSFFNILSEIDYDFSNVRSYFNSLSNLTFDFSIESFADLLLIVVNFFKALVSPIVLLFTLVADIASLLFSVLGVLMEMMGVEVYGSLIFPN